MEGAIKIDNQIYGIIYKIVNKINNKIYIGQTTQKRGYKDRYKCRGCGIERIYNYYKLQMSLGYSYNKHLFLSIEKYGFDNFAVDEVFDIAYCKDQLDEKETYWINYYKSYDKKYGYNIKLGGANGQLNEYDYLNRCRKTGKPIVCLTTGQIFISIREASRETNISRDCILNCCKGIQKSTTNKKINQHFEFQYLENVNKKNKIVICITTNQRFFSIADAGKYYNCDRATISKCCGGKLQSAGVHPITGEKLVWEYLLF